MPIRCSSMLIFLAACGELPTEELKGEDGSDGVSTLLNTVEEPAGDNCEQGGTAISYGTDDNGDGVLNEDEVDETSYICDGPSGEVGAQGTEGAQGDAQGVGRGGGAPVASRHFDPRYALDRLLSHR